MLYTGFFVWCILSDEELCKLLMDGATPRNPRTALPAFHAGKFQGSPVLFLVRQLLLAPQLNVTGSAKTEHNSAIQIFQYKALKHIG